MRSRLTKAALLTALLALPAGHSGAQQDAPDGADADEAQSGPVVRRAPPPTDIPVPEALLPEPGEDARPGERPMLEVLDASVFEGVFAPYIVRDGRAIPEALTDEPGDPVSGRRLFHNFSRTGCSLCHGTAEAPRRPDSGRTAPPLDRVADRLTPARIRLWIVAPQTIRPATTMPAFHKPGQRTDVEDPLYGGPRLTAAEVEDLVAYLSQTSLGKVR